MFRTTVSLEPEIMELAKSMAQERKISLSDSINFLIRRGLSAKSQITETNGFAVFQVPANASQFGPDDVEKALLEA